jgi:catechol 2,3-dioxygenase-like lactoylglutathione lyase family enzyme
MLQHVTLEVAPHQVRDCVAFWALLGFTEMVPPPLLRDHYTWVEREGTQIHYAPADDPSPPARQGHVAIVAPDYDQVVQALQDAGFELTDGSNAWGARRTFVRDPAGHRVEVMAAPPHPPWPGE